MSFEKTALPVREYLAHRTGDHAAGRASSFRRLAWAGTRVRADIAARAGAPGCATGAHKRYLIDRGMTDRGNFRAALAAIPADDRDLLGEWSQRGERRRSFGPGRVTIGTLSHEAQVRGFKPERAPDAATADERRSRSRSQAAAPSRGSAVPSVPRCSGSRRCAGTERCWRGRLVSGAAEGADLLVVAFDASDLGKLAQGLRAAAPPARRWRRVRAAHGASIEAGGIDAPAGQNQRASGPADAMAARFDRFRFARPPDPGSSNAPLARGVAEDQGNSGRRDSGTGKGTKRFATLRALAALAVASRGGRTITHADLDVCRAVARARLWAPT